MTVFGPTHRHQQSNRKKAAAPQRHKKEPQLTFRPTPTPLPNEKRTPHSPTKHLARPLLDKQMLRLDHGPGLLLVVNAHHLGPQLQLPALAAHGQRFQKLNRLLAVHDSPAVQLRHAGDAGPLCGLRGVEVYDLWRCGFEGQDDGVGWEDGEVGVEFLWVGGFL